MKRIFAIILNLFLYVVSFAAWLSMVFQPGPGGALSAGGLYSLKYYTTLSNLFNGAVCLVYAAELPSRKEVGIRLRMWKLSSTAAVGLTFLTVIGFFGPVYGYGSMFLGSNFWLHLVLPLLSMLSFALLERGEKLPFWGTFWAVVPTLLYTAGYLGNVMLQGPGEWPDRHDFYGFLLWGWPIGIAIACALVLALWVLAVLLRQLNGKRR